MHGLTTRHFTGILGVVFLLCGMTPFARADIVLIPLDGSSDAKPENYGYKVAAWRIGDLAVIRLDLSTDAEKAFLGGTLTLSKAGREIVSAPVWLSEKKKDGAAIVLKVDTNAIDGGELEFSSGDIGGMGLGRASGFRLDIARLLKKAASREQDKAAETSKATEQSRDRDPRQFPNKEAQPLKAIAKPTATKVRAGESVEVELSVQNKTTEKQTIRIWSCSWYENWQSDNAAVSIADAWPCSDNGPMSVEIAPGKAHKFVRGQEKNAHLNVDAKAPPGKITFRLGFSNCADAIKDLPEVFWSEPITVEVVAANAEGANPPPRPDPETPGMRKGALFENPKALEATPDELRKTYAAFVTAIQNGAVPTEFLLPSAVSVSTEPRPEKTAEYGQDINVRFLKKGFSSAVQLVRKDADDSYLIRTGTTAIWFVETKSGKWKIYRYSDKPIE